MNIKGSQVKSNRYFNIKGSKTKKKLATLNLKLASLRIQTAIGQRRRKLELERRRHCGCGGYRFGKTHTLIMHTAICLLTKQ